MRGWAEYDPSHQFMFDPDAAIEGEFPRYLAESENDSSFLEFLKHPKLEWVELGCQFTWPDVLRDLAPTEQLKQASRVEKIDQGAWVLFIKWALANAPDLISKLVVDNGSLWSHFSSRFIKPRRILPSKRFLDEFVDCSSRSPGVARLNLSSGKIVARVNAGLLLATEENFDALIGILTRLCTPVATRTVEFDDHAVTVMGMWLQIAAKALQYDKPEAMSVAKEILSRLLSQLAFLDRDPAALLCSLKVFYEPSVWRKTVFELIKDPEWCTLSQISIDTPSTIKDPQLADRLVVPLAEHFEADPLLMVQVLKLPHFSFSSIRLCPFACLFPQYLLHNMGAFCPSPTPDELHAIYECYRLIVDSKTELKIPYPVPDPMPALLESFFLANPSYRERYDLAGKFEKRLAIWKFFSRFENTRIQDYPKEAENFHSELASNLEFAKEVFSSLQPYYQ